ncbi:hypothetical protein BH11PLA1_BH11PLA1_13930 [soil metagenome]
MTPSLVCGVRGVLRRLRCQISVVAMCLGAAGWTGGALAQLPYMVKDINPNGQRGSSPGNFTLVGERVFFAATADEVGRELFVTDGTAGGTRLVADLNPGPAGSTFDQIAALDAQHALAVTSRAGVLRRVLIISDGTAGGTSTLAVELSVDGPIVSDGGGTPCLSG